MSSDDTTDTTQYRYSAALARDIESKWHKAWAEHGTFDVANPVGTLSGDSPTPRERTFYVLDMFPYPSGSGLHVGHPLGFIGSDVYARFMRMKGNTVLHPFGFDAFGLPAEQYAIETGQHPATTTTQNINNMRRQLRRLGLAHDPRREISTADPAYYRWTQWIFLQIFNCWCDPATGRARPIADLIGQFEAGSREPVSPANPSNLPWRDLDTITRRRVEVTADGRSDIGNYPVYRRRMRQWMLRITAFADRLLEDLEPLDWSDSLKLMQRSWIGRSEGADVYFTARTPHGAQRCVEVYTTRPDTLFGVTFIVLAPEHPLVAEFTADEWPPGTPTAWHGASPAGGPAGSPREAANAYVQQSSSLSDRQRQARTTKTAVFTGSDAVSPVSGEQVPVFIADYVLACALWSGLTMHGWPSTPPQPPMIRRVGASRSRLSTTRRACRSRCPSRCCLSSCRRWPTSAPNRLRVMSQSHRCRGRRASSTSSWTSATESGCTGARPTPCRSGPAPVSTTFVTWTRRTRSSSWIQRSSDTGWAAATMSGGSVGRTCISVAWSMPCCTCCTPASGTSSCSIWATCRRLSRSSVHTTRGTSWPTRSPIHGKMGKSLKNAIAPDEIYDSYGADTLRMYEMAMGPLDVDRPWQPDDIVGVFRLLQRLWRNIIDEQTGQLRVAEGDLAPDEPLFEVLHRTIDAVDRLYIELRYNVAIARITELNNALGKYVQRHGASPRQVAEALVLMVCPLAQHVASELWEKLGHDEAIDDAPFPTADPDALVQTHVILPVTVNGKPRGEITVDQLASQAEVTEAGLALEAVAKLVEGKEIVRVVVVPEKIVNFVIR